MRKKLDGGGKRETPEEAKRLRTDLSFASKNGRRIMEEPVGGRS